MTHSISRWLKTNQGLGVITLILMLLLVYYMWQQPWFHRVQRDRFTLGFFPAMGVVAVMVCAFAMTIDQWRKVITDEMAELAWDDLGWSVLFVVVSYILFQSTAWLGLPLAATVFMAVLMWLLGARPWQRVLWIAPSVAVAVFVLFSILGVRLPGGFFPLLGI